MYICIYIYIYMYMYMFVACYPPIAKAKICLTFGRLSR